MTSWFILHVNIRLIEDGIAVYRPDPAKHMLEPRLISFAYSAAAGDAVKNRVGIWQDATLGKRIQQHIK